MTTSIHPESTPNPNDPMQPACPAFTRWMQRRVLRGGAKRVPTAQPHTSPKAGQNVARPAVLTPPSDDELSVAALKDLQQRLHCKNAFLQEFLTRLQQHSIVTNAWLQPLPRPMGGAAAASAAGSGTERRGPQAVGLPTEFAHPVTWVRPIDDIWTVALQAARDPSLAHHERELAFVVALVRPLLEDTAFRLGYSHEDLSLLPCIKAARRACSDEGVSDFETQHPSNASHVEAQAVLLKSLLIPEMIDVDAECIHLAQRDRISRAVDRAMQVLRVNWAEPEPIQPLARTCLTPRHHTTERSAVAHPGGRRNTLNRGASR